MSKLGHLRKRCAGCNRSDVSMNKEHIFPEWLILRTGTHQTGIRWGDKRNVSALRVTLPLCTDCNDDFGRELESPTSRLFDDLERGKGMSDYDAELLIRWMWKIAGLAWIAAFPRGRYTNSYSLRDRVLYPIDAIRGELVLGVGLIAAQHPESKDLPMGLDSTSVLNAVFVSGVFSMIAMMVVQQEFEELIPQQFGRYRLAPRRDDLTSGKLFFPPTSFEDDFVAVQTTRHASNLLSILHDEYGRRIQDARK